MDASVAPVSAATKPLLERRSGVERGLGLAFPSLLVAYAGFGLFMVARTVLRDSAPRAAVGQSAPYGYSWVVVALFVPYALTLVAWRVRGCPLSLPRLLAVVVMVWTPLVLARPLQSHDVYQYVFYARMQIVHGANPYVTPPTALGGDSWRRAVPWPGQVSVYGPLWTTAVAEVVRLSIGSLRGAVLVVKAFAGLLGGITLWGLVALSRSEVGTAPRADPRPAVAIFGLNPLVAASVALGGHADIALAAALVWAIVWQSRRRPLLASTLLGVGALVKLYGAIPLLVFLLVRWKREGFRAVIGPSVLCSVLAGVAYAPYWAGWATVRGLLHVAGSSSSSLGGVIERWAIAGLSALGVDRAAPLAATAVGSAALLAIGITIAAGVRHASEHDATWHTSLAALSIFLAMTPWFLPWYLVAPLALAAALYPGDTLSGPMVAFSGSCMATVGGLGGLPMLLARYGPPAAGLALTRSATGRRTLRAGPLRYGRPRHRLPRP
ncbi:MAG TPA: glycosyltransferase family 87 protein [Actinomycetota bacterium]